MIYERSLGDGVVAGAAVSDRSLVGREIALCSHCHSQHWWQNQIYLDKEITANFKSFALIYIGLKNSTIFQNISNQFFFELDIYTWFFVHGWKQFLDSMNENVNIMCFGENAFKQQRII